MKLTVKKTFRDKTDHVTVYEPGTILDVKDKERAADLVKRGLCAEYKGKKDATVTLGEDEAEATGDTPPAAGEKPLAEDNESDGKKPAETK